MSVISYRLKKQSPVPYDTGQMGGRSVRGGHDPFHEGEPFGRTVFVEVVADFVRGRGRTGTIRKDANCLLELAAAEDRLLWAEEVAVLPAVVVTQSDEDRECASGVYLSASVTAEDESGRVFCDFYLYCCLV